MITIIDYGSGNIQAIANIYKRLNIPSVAAKTAEEIDAARHIILPGVGAFDPAMARLNRSGMRAALDRRVESGAAKVLGICVGMQMLATRSDEGSETGLGWIDAEVRLFEEERFIGPTHLPHMGWNDVSPRRPDGLFAQLDSEARFYFLHSYYFSPNRSEDVLAVTDYNGEFACSVHRDNVYGVQFHPEKSHQWGIQLLKNFAGL